MKLTTADVQRYVRIALQWLAAYLATKGFIDPNASWITPVSGAILAIATLGWTMYGNRIQAKIDEFVETMNDPNALATIKDQNKDAKVALLNAAATVPGTEAVVNPYLGNDPATKSNVVVQA